MSKKRCLLFFSSSKKANQVLFEVVKLAGAVTFLILVLSISYAKARGEDVIATYTAKDLALFMDTLMALPGDVSVHYPFPEFHNTITVTIGKNNISLDGLGFAKATFFFIPDNSFSIQERKFVIKPREYFELPIVKKGNSIFFDPVDLTQNIISLLPEVRINSFDSNLASSTLVFSYNKEDLFSEYVSSYLLSDFSDLSENNFYSVSSDTDMDYINSLYPNYYIGIVFVNDSFFSDKKVDVFIDYNSYSPIESYSRKLAVIYYNSFLLDTSFSDISLGDINVSDRGLTVPDLSLLKYPGLTLYISEDVRYTLGDKTLSKLIVKGLHDYYKVMV